MRIVALIVAGGRGTRAHSGGVAKQYLRIGSAPILTRSVAPFLDHRSIDRVRVVIGADDEAEYRAAMRPDKKLMAPVFGADDRQGSVRNGLESLAGDPPDKVLIHDGARPFANAALIDRVVEKLHSTEGAIPVLPVVSTLKRVGQDGVLGETVSRAGLTAAQTPQGFSFDRILDAHRRVASGNQVYTDDAAVAAAAGIDVHGVEGDAGNTKLTTAADISAADQAMALREMQQFGDVRVGVGYDVHALGAGTQVMLGGISIDHNAGLIGHSDADVILHALTDAVLGALGDGDIGSHFPPSEVQWRDAQSSQFLSFAAARVKERGGMIAHLDVTLVGEGPKLAPHRDRIRARIADICGIPVERVGAKATTSEGLGFTGRREGLAAHAIATIRLPLGAVHA